ncbi:hypothetical protein FPRO05_14002 [Fusarium proliferatum]|uniref:CCHC-type domain-containing protein n=1 Tax=Gibberella intermedia TaxID=948311 RepID=A0A365MX67_GIBIN|nr:hypothetical protein FPRO05_14002 [Fusarium proliferatum]
MELDPTAFVPKPIRIVVIGAGISGIQFLKDVTTRLPNVNITVYDKNSEEGGTWAENRYPGCACDIPSHAYQYSWNPNPRWSRLYAEAAEILDYLKSTVAKFDLRRYIQFGTTCTGANWGEMNSEWSVSLQSNENTNTEVWVKCDVFVIAIGRLNNWKLPDIKGLDTFQGRVIHTANWPQGLDYRDKDIAVIGNGASSTQCLASLRKDTRSISNFIRGPTWLNSPAVVNSPIGVSHRPGRTAQTPSSPLNGTITATAAEGAKRVNPESTLEQQPISIIESANDLAREHAEEYNAKLMVFQAFCTKFEEAAEQFTSGPQRRFAQKFADSFLDSWKQELSSDVPASKPTYSSVAAASLPADRARTAHQHHHQQQQQHRQSGPPHRQGQQATTAPPRQDLRVFIRLEAGAPARAHSSYAIRTLIKEKLGTVSDKVRQVFQVRSGWAVLTADHETRDFLVEKQAEWAAELGATAVETNKEWHTYVVSDFPRRLTDFRGNEVDSDSVVSDEIEIQTGLKPVDIRTGRQFSDNPLTKTLLVSFLKPTKKRFWSLFGSRAARLIDKTDIPKQCETCWGYHFARNCHRQPVCHRCGKTGHSVDDCTAWEQCVNCLGPHDASLRRCPARPKKVRGVLRRLSKEQREHVRIVGAETYRQRHLDAQPESHMEIRQDTTEMLRDDTPADVRPDARDPSPAASGAPSCIMVATAPRAGYEIEEPEHHRPGSPKKKRRIILTTRTHDHDQE